MPRPSIDRQLELIATLREPTRRRLYEFVERQPHAVSRDQAATAAGVTRALAAFHLDKLVAAGFLRTEYRRLSGRTGPGAGRSSKLYRRSRLAFHVTLPHRDHEFLARLLIDALNESTRDALDLSVAHDRGRSLGSRARQGLRGHITDDHLLECVEDVLQSIGFDPYRGSAGEIRLRNCPFDPLSRLYEPIVCGLGNAIVRGVVQGVGAEQVNVERQPVAEECCSVLVNTKARGG